MGFTEITAFDYVPEMIKSAEHTKQKRQSKVNFLILDAANLDSIETNSFDYLIYLQQIICFIPEQLREQSIYERYDFRKWCPGGLLVG